MQDNLINKAIQNINNAQTEFNNIKPVNAQAKKQDYINTMNTTTNNLEKKTWYSDILDSYLSQMTTYNKQYANTPLLWTMKKQYVNKAPTEDIDALTQKMMENRDTLDARVGAMAQNQWVAIDPSKMYSLSSRMKSFYDNQINSLQKEKASRINQAEIQAQIDYQDKIQRLRQLDGSINNLKSMLNLAWRQVQDGKMDTRSALKLQQQYDQQNNTLQKEIANASLKTWQSQLALWQTVKSMDLKQQATASDITYKNALTWRVQDQQKKQDLWNIWKAYNLKTTQVIAKDQTTWLPIFTTPTQWGKRYFDVTWKIDDWKHIWAIANNPWNLTYNWKNWEYLQQLWAIWFIKSDNWRVYAVFPDETTGKKAIWSLLSTWWYINSTVLQALKRYVWTNNPIHLKLVDKNILNKRIWDLTTKEKDWLIDTITKAEQGWFKPETYNPMASKSKTSTIKPTDIINWVKTTLTNIANENAKNNNGEKVVTLSNIKSVFKEVGNQLLDQSSDKAIRTKAQLIKQYIPLILNSTPSNNDQDSIQKQLIQIAVQPWTNKKWNTTPSIMESHKNLFKNYLDRWLLDWVKGNWYNPVTDIKNLWTFLGNTYDKTIWVGHENDASYVYNLYKTNPDFKKTMDDMFTKWAISASKTVTANNKSSVENMWNLLTN